MNHAKVAKDVLAAIGGKTNLQAAAHCATRLRLVIKDESHINQKALDEQQDVKGTFNTNGQFQVIIGPGDVDYVYAELIKLTGLPDMSKEEASAVAGTKRGNIFLQFIKVLSDIFIPIIPALVAGGLLMALNNVLTAPGLFTKQPITTLVPALTDVAAFINMMAAAPFVFLPVLIGFSATKRFGGNPFLGAAMGMIMVSPSLVNGYSVATAAAAGKLPYWHIFGLNIAQAGYQGTVLPVLVVAFILAKLERFFHKHISNAFDFTFTPMLAIIITGFLTFTFVGPIMRGVGDGLTTGIMWLYTTTGPVGTAIFGFFYSAIVITGLHQSFPAIETQLLANKAVTGGSFIFPIATMANVAQGAACLAVFFITKNKKQKGLASSSSISALLGITEPAIFGVNLKLKFPFVCAMIGSGVASIFIGLFNILAISMGPASVIGFICIRAQSIPMYLVASAISIVIAFSLTYVYGKRKLALVPADGVVTSDVDEINAEPEADVSAPVAVFKDEVIGAPVAGQATSLKTVKDKVFSSELMGRGAAVMPENGTVTAPCAGVITVTYPTGHAYGLRTDSGADVLIHIGIDTVNLKGEHFKSFVQQNERVSAGQKLAAFDLPAIEKDGYDPTVIVVVTNTADYASVDRVKTDHVVAGAALIALTAK
ncbi:MAG: sucrose-specific PTS transporter subunit IIBC [Sporolactobacillus sp.]